MKNQVKKAVDAVQELRARLVALVDGLPESAKGVTRLGNNCGMVSSSMIAANKGILSPEYYLTDAAKGQLKNIFRNTRLVNLEKIVQEIINTGTIPVSGTATHGTRMKVCQEFCDALDKLWYGEEQEIV